MKNRSGQGRNRTADASLFRAALFRWNKRTTSSPLASCISRHPNAILRTAADPNITTAAGAAGGTFHGIDPLHYRLPAQSGDSAEPYGADRRAMEDAAIYDLASHDELVKLRVR